MPVPTYDQFIEPVLRFLAQNANGAYTRDVYEAAAKALNVSDTDRLQVLPSGRQAVYKNRIGWAYDRLKRAGLASSPKRGSWCLTAKGFEYAKNHPLQLSEESIDGLAKDFSDVPVNKLETEAMSLGQTPLAPIETHASPDDRLFEVLGEMRSSVIQEISDALRKVSPTFFETIVLDVLHRMGYGASRSDLQQVGGVGDGGIDGIISLDKLGLEKIYVQAKRWQHSVGRPEVQAFYGALAGQRANKGILSRLPATRPKQPTSPSRSKELFSSMARVLLIS